MDVLIAFLIFIGAMVACLLADGPMLLPLLAGFVCFYIVALHKGFSFRQTAGMALKGAGDSLVVIRVLLMIGFLTALWRSAGTITFFVYYGIQIITPSMFIMITFLLACLLSYALGTSFGVAGTVGVIFMALARSGGVSEIVTAGAVMSGVYFGDRASPASSSANLVAAVTHTKLYDNVKLMMKTGLFPLILSAGIYLLLSIKHPISHVDEAILDALRSDFSINLWLIVPAVLMLVLPLFKVSVMIAMTASVLSAAAVSIFAQGLSFVETFQFAVLGYTAKSGNLGEILNGGGMVSMLEVCGIVLLSCSYSGIFSGTQMLESIQALLERLMSHIGKFGVMLVTGIAATGIFCNQTIASIMCSDLLAAPYEKRGASREELAMDIENSVIVTAGLMPWAIACTVPLGMLGVGISALPYAVLLYLIPACYIVTKKIWYPA
ncbi:sodium:proton antiporter [bacterium 210820-DFI.6.37]|nr:sodium:proton antiporter [bacterium 210820-DFI.6.37]